jgi:hypothetical protein
MNDGSFAESLQLFRERLFLEVFLKIEVTRRALKKRDNAVEAVFLRSPSHLIDKYSRLISLVLKMRAVVLRGAQLSI